VAYVPVNAEAVQEVPEGILGVLFSYEYKVWAPDGMEQIEAYEHQRRGKCMACGRPLGEDTIIVVTSDGIIGLWDGGDCLSDMQALTFLRHVEEGVVESLQERGQE
jgi:hypothetical protein